MRDVSIGQHYPSNSIVHRMDARVKLILVIMYIVMIFFIDTFTGFGLVALFVLFCIFLSKVPLLKVLKSLRMIIFLVLFTMVLSLLFYSGDIEDRFFHFGFINLYWTGLFNALKLALRLVLLVLGPSLLTLTTTPVELTDGLERLLKPFALMHLPVHELAIIMSIALRLIPTLIEETDKIINAQKARGADFDSKNLFKKAKALLPILIPLFVSSFRRADELADAMDSRCYRGAKGRTRMKVMKFKLRDFIALFVMTALLFAILLLKYNWFGFVFIGFLL